MIEFIRPDSQRTIADHACGTGGFFLTAYDFLVREHKLNKAQKEFLNHETFHGHEIVPGFLLPPL
jgi:type I restriction enzyme M protein